jgi:hypothetical protein
LTSGVGLAADAGDGFGLAAPVARGCGAGVGAGPGFFSGTGVATIRGGTAGRGVCPDGTVPGCVVGVRAGLVSGLGDTFGATRFGGVGFGTLGDPPGIAVGDGFWPAGSCLGPGVPVGFGPIKFGGTDFVAAAGAFGEPPGLALTAGTFPPGLPVGFTRFGGVCFWPGAGAGEPVGLGDPVACPFFKICGVGNGVGFGRSFDGGFC